VYISILDTNFTEDSAHMGIYSVIEMESFTCLFAYILS
jgi:hypothetical protein